MYLTLTPRDETVEGSALSSARYIQSVQDLYIAYTGLQERFD